MRKQALNQWMQKVDAGTLLTVCPFSCPPVLKLFGVSKTPVGMHELFRPRTFLNALRQQTARACNCCCRLLFTCHAIQQTSQSTR